jgi:hypothetical protein
MLAASAGVLWSVFVRFGPLSIPPRRRGLAHFDPNFNFRLCCLQLYKNQNFSARGITLPRMGATVKAPRNPIGAGDDSNPTERDGSLFFLLFRSGVSRGVGSPLGRGLFWGVFCGATRCEGEGGRAGLPRGQTALQREALYVAVARCS